MTTKVLYEELVPQEFRERVAACPVAYLPLGTLEWHGEHLPIAADGIQSKGFFERLARDVGGVVLPMLFMGPDRVEETDEGVFYGMDIVRDRETNALIERNHLAGSAYWLPPELFKNYLEAIFFQLKRAGFKLVVAHGHGPSTVLFEKHSRYSDEWQKKFGIEFLSCWNTEASKQGFGVQCDHAAANETSLTWALRPELVQLDRLPKGPDAKLVGIGGKDPRIFASKEMGEKIIALNLAEISAQIRGILKKL